MMSQMSIQDCTFSPSTDKVSEYSPFQHEGVRRSAAREDVDRFDQAMEDRSQSGDTDQEQAQTALPQGGVPFAMGSPLESLFAGRIEQAVAAQPLLSEVELEALVERILVSTPESGGNEVRLTLGGDLLKGTEIVIQRDALGQLSVQLHASEAAAFRALTASQAELRDRLEVHEAAEVHVAIAYEHSGNSAEHRSRGLFQQYHPEA